jgi:hypothetical protein
VHQGLGSGHSSISSSKESPSKNQRFLQEAAYSYRHPHPLMYLLRSFSMRAPAVEIWKEKKQPKFDVCCETATQQKLLRMIRKNNENPPSASYIAVQLI